MALDDDIVEIIATDISLVIGF